MSYFFDATKSFKIKKEGTCVSCILDTDEIFSQVGYKVMQSQETGLFIESVKINYNGKIKLLYATEGYVTLAEVFEHETVAAAWDTLFKMSDGILQVINNGFLGCENLVLAFDYIYFDNEILKPHFIYLPLVRENVDNVLQRVEEEFSDRLIKMVGDTKNADSAEKKIIIEELGSQPYSFAHIRQCAHKHLESPREMRNVKNQQPLEGIVLESISKQMPLKFFAAGSKFSIGRRSDNDGVIDFSKRISRHHCTIVNRNGKFGVVDEKSKFGTILNSIHCEPGRFYELHIGDELRLPGITFRVR